MINGRVKSLICSVNRGNLYCVMWMCRERFGSNIEWIPLSKCGTSDKCVLSFSTIAFKKPIEYTVDLFLPFNLKTN